MKNQLLQENDFIPFRPTLKQLRVNSRKHDFQTNSTITYPKDCGTFSNHYDPTSIAASSGINGGNMPSLSKQDIQNHVTEINDDNTEDSENEYTSPYSIKRKRNSAFVEMHIHDEPSQLTDEENDDIEIMPPKRTCILNTCKYTLISVFILLLYNF